MSLITMKDTGEVPSVSAVTKTQQANGAILFGKNATVILKRLGELIKIKELDTSKLEAILDVLADADATTALAKKAAGKNLVTAVKNLYKAKTLVATINALRAIKIKPTAGNITPAKTTRPVRSNTVDANGKIERNKWYVADLTRHANDVIIKGPFKTEEEAEANVETSKNKRVIIQEAMTGQNCLDEGLTWTQNPDQKQTGGTPGSRTTKTSKAIKTGKFEPAYSTLRRQNSMLYAQDFITAVEPEAGRGVLGTTSRSAFRFQYKKLNIAVSMLQKGWSLVFEGPHLKEPRKVQIHLGELESIKNVIKLLSTKDATDAQITAAAVKGKRKL
ncbi:hypothetical protein D5P86_01385 [Salmonella enterica subsp. enterica serovar Infantis]|nr:hypothetical protein [Salmonella enterica subsp. enterica serovar Infantis]